MITPEKTYWLACAHEHCHVLFAIPDAVDNRLRKTHETFYCLFGHSQSYTGETEEEKLKADLKTQQERNAALIRERYALQVQLNRKSSKRGRPRKK